MNSEINQSSERKEIKYPRSNIPRKIYNREDFFRFYKCFEEIPFYLKDFEYLYNNFIEENWCKKPIPKFEEVAPEVKGKLNYSVKLRPRLRTLSNQSGDENVQDTSTENYRKQRNYNRHSGKFNRFGPDNMSIEKQQPDFDYINENNRKFINFNDFTEHSEDGQWLKVESRFLNSKTSNSSKTYAQNIQLNENHWKKWTKDHTSLDKNKSQNVNFNRSDRGSNVWSKKNDTQNVERNAKSYNRHSFSKSGDQTEDIWQDDWDTEMKSEIAKEDDDLVLDRYEFSKSTLIPLTPPVIEEEQKPTIPTFDNTVDSVKSSFYMWYYRDLSDQEQGPFPSENMANWLATGYFNPSTFVRRQCDERFLLLAEYRALYGRIPFTAGQAIPPIYNITPIEIDIKQLLIGVDVNLIPQVINCATSLPKISPQQISHNNIVTRVEENINISSNNAERMALIEEKRMIEESRLELERQRERMNQEIVQWRERFEAELKAMEEMKQSFVQSNISTLEKLEGNDEVISSQTEMQIESDKPDNSIILTKEVDKQNNIEIQSPTIMDTTISLSSSDKVDATSTATENNQWLSNKDTKSQRKTKKSKSKEISSKEDKEIVALPEPKRPEIPRDTKITVVSKESFPNSIQKENIESKSKAIKNEPKRRTIESMVSWSNASNQKTTVSNIVPKSLLEIQEEEIARDKEKQSNLIAVEADSLKITDNQNKIDVNRKNDATVSWNISHLPSGNSNALPVTKSLLEIQAEEQLKEKKQKDFEELLKSKENEAHKVTSFKESLLKTSKTSKPTLIPVGKSIWDMSPLEITSQKSPILISETFVKTEKDVKSSKVQTKESVNKKEINNNSDQLTLWCLKKLSIFSEKFDVQTVIELLKDVPNEEVMDLALQLIDDSKFTNNFVIEFISKRQELFDNQNRENWQTVKKPVTQAVSGTKVQSNNPLNKTSKSKSKKKVFVLDAKFR